MSLVEDGMGTGSRVRGTIVAMAALGSVGGAAAQEADGGDTATLPEISVVGEGDAAEGGFLPPAEIDISGFEAPPRELPATVNVVPGELFIDLGANRLRDVVDYVPGVNARETNGGTGDAFIIRGFPTNEVALNGLRRRTFTNQSEALYNIERVEILKGPAGLEVGIVEPGGVVNFVTKKPRDVAAYEAFAEYGSFDFFNAGVDATGPVPGVEGLSYRFIAEGENRQSFRDTFDAQRALVAPSLKWDYAPDSSVLLELEYNYSDIPYDRGIFYLEGVGFEDGFAPIGRSFHELDDELETHQVRGGLYLDHGFTQALSFRASAEYIYEDYESFGARNPDPGGLYAPGTNVFSGDPTVERGFVFFAGDQDQILTKAELVGDFSTGPVDHFVLGGVSYSMTDTFIIGRDGQTDWPIDAFDPVYGTEPVVVGRAEDGVGRDFVFEQGSDVYGVFGQYKADIHDRLHIVGGLRFDRAEFTDRYTDNVNTDPPGEETGYEDSGLSYRVGASVDVTDWLAAFAGYSSAFEPQPGEDREGNRFEGLRSKSVEAGVKAGFLDEAVQLGVTAFRIRQENIAEPDPNNLPGEDFLSLIGTARSRGVEVSLLGEVTPDLDVLGAITFLDTEITESTSGQEGNAFYGAPDFQIAAYGRYDFTRLGAPGLGASLGVVHVGDRAGDNDNSFTLPSYTRVDAGLSYTFRNVTARLSVSNLLDERIILGSQNRPDNVLPGAPRTFVGGLTVNF